MKKANLTSTSNPSSTTTKLHIKRTFSEKDMYAIHLSYATYVPVLGAE